MEAGYEESIEYLVGRFLEAEGWMPAEMLAVWLVVEEVRLAVKYSKELREVFSDFWFSVYNRL